MNWSVRKQRHQTLVFLIVDGEILECQRYTIYSVYGIQWCIFEMGNSRNSYSKTTQYEHCRKDHGVVKDLNQLNHHYTCSNFEANASELLENLEERFSRHYMHCDIIQIQILNHTTLCYPTRSGSCEVVWKNTDQRHLPCCWKKHGGRPCSITWMILFGLSSQVHKDQH